MKLARAAAVLVAIAASSGGVAQIEQGGTPRSIAGIVLDSEYLIFVVDTSGSMKQFAWDEVAAHIRDTLAAYPALAGVQVLNDDGHYLLPRTQGEWLPYTPALEAEIAAALPSWDAYSNSQPHEGIVEAIETFYDPGKRISLYVYSDDFAQAAVESTVAAVDRANRVDGTGDRKVRINAVAFPAIYEATSELYSAANYAVLMNELCRRNGGSFIALAVR